MSLDGPGDARLQLAQCTPNQTGMSPGTLPGIEGLVPPRNAVRGVYIHVPFCRHRCHYCDFFTIAGRDDAFEAFADRLIDELSRVPERLDGEVDTVFIGGGTPTLLPPRVLGRVLEAVGEHLPLRGDCEWTVEANPETVTAERADVLAASGVNRVSLGAQSFDTGLLAALERQHDPESVPRSLDLLRQAGIDRLSLDLIFAIPGQSLEQWDADLQAVLDLGVEHLSAYSLVYEPGTPLTRRRDRGAVQPVDEEVEARMFEHAIDVLQQQGFDQYEVSNWARSGHRCRHNLVYWRNENWWPVGPGAAGHVDGVRWKNLPRLSSYLEGEGLPAVTMTEQLDEDGRIGETFMLGLRLLDGMEREQVESLLGRGDRATARREAIDRRILGGEMEWAGDRLRFTRSGLLVADSINLELL